MLFRNPNINQRKIYFFTCKKCHKERRQSLLKDRAESGLCAKCRRAADSTPEGREPLFKKRR